MKPVAHNMVQVFGDLDDSEDDSDFDISKYGEHGDFYRIV